MCIHTRTSSNLWTTLYLLLSRRNKTYTALLGELLAALRWGVLEQGHTKERNKKIGLLVYSNVTNKVETLTAVSVAVEAR
jgi:hypothetical protein